MTGWLVNIIPVPYPGLEDAPESYKKAWRKYVDSELTVTPGADREDWLEQAARLEAAMSLLDDPLLRIYGRDAIMDRDGKPVGQDTINGRAYYGEVLNADIRRPADYPLETGNAHRYANSPMVRRLMHRETMLVPVNADGVERAVRAVASAEPAYRGIAALLPPSEALDRTGGTLGFFDKRRLEKTERELVEGLLMQGSWTDEQCESYLTYLRERGGLESPSFRALYEFFADHTTI